MLKYINMLISDILIDLCTFPLNKTMSETTVYKWKKIELKILNRFKNNFKSKRYYIYSLKGLNISLTMIINLI